MIPPSGRIQRPLGLVLLLLAAAVPPAQAKTPAPRTVVLASLEVHDRSGDPVLTPARAESLFRAVLARGSFERLERGTHYGPAEGHAIANPMRAPELAAAGDTVFLNVDLELEQSTYAIFGAVGRTIGEIVHQSATDQPSDKGDAMGLVQWRMTLDWNGAKAPRVSAVADTSFGSFYRMSREVAVLRANRKVMRTLGWLMADQLDRSLSLGLDRKRVQKSWRTLMEELETD